MSRLMKFPSEPPGKVWFAGRRTCGAAGVGANVGAGVGACVGASVGADAVTSDG